MKKTTKVLGTATLATAVLFSTVGNVTHAADNTLDDALNQANDGFTPIEDATNTTPSQPDVVGGINPELDLNNNGILDFEEEDVAPSNPVVTNPTPSNEQPTTETPTVEAPTTETPTTEAPTVEQPTTEAPTTEVPTTEELNLDTVKLTKEVPYKDVIKTDKSPGIINQIPLPLKYKVGEWRANFENLKVGIKVETQDGTDLQDTLKIESNIDFNKPGEYVVKYTAGVGEDISELYVLAIVEGEAPTTEVPTTEAPTTENPTTEVPTTETPTTEAPTTENPTTEVPTTETPTTEAPTTEVPTVEETTTEEVTTETNVDTVGSVEELASTEEESVETSVNTTDKVNTKHEDSTTSVNATENKSTQVADANKAVEVSKQENMKKEELKQLPDTGETDNNTGMIAGLLMAMGLGFLVKRKKSVNQ
ncbi:LPXTG cell wall anchor domain-containing protein [Macrococcoides canis]|uniref:LPXTG cell wall anchor domain-containing protein n=1 Tax=Macrococcoides canis TaxID=1855823 RepID=UPI00165D773A|nr:LPXTG cell wall anchor domain-containing protein [Macrococcus canis]QNR09107.1 LPXTG cell wall anchor domain-containing protein [Macrococcus canis]